jgi:hypothetical protein
LLLLSCHPETREDTLKIEERPRSANARRSYPLQEYAAIGDGRSIAILGPEGTVVWWCVPNLDSLALFDSLLDPHDGGFFALQPAEAFEVERRYRVDSNVLESTFTTAEGVLRLTEAMNSSLAGRLPWCEFARRIEVLSGAVRIIGRLVFGTKAETVSPCIQKNENGTIFHVGPVLGMLRTTPNLIVSEVSDRSINVEGTSHAGQRGF